jgi:hypothetical protein
MSVASAKTPFLEYSSTTLTAQISAGTGISFTKVLPAGEWLITGSTRVTGALTSVEIFTPVRTIYKLVATVTDVQAPVSFLYTSNGTTALTISITASTSSSTWASASTFIDCKKLIE